MLVDQNTPSGIDLDTIPQESQKYDVHNKTYGRPHILSAWEVFQTQLCIVDHREVPLDHREIFVKADWEQEVEYMMQDKVVGSSGKNISYQSCF